MAGGSVHFVLGNHEAMIMAGDLRYVHGMPMYAAQLIGLTYDQLFGESSELGQWFRTRNSVMKIGSLLFVHAGYSPRLNAEGLSISEVNNRVRAFLGRPAEPRGKPLADRLPWDRHGPPLVPRLLRPARPSVMAALESQRSRQSSAGTRSTALLWGTPWCPRWAGWTKLESCSASTSSGVNRDAVRACGTRMNSCGASTLAAARPGSIISRPSSR